MTTRFPKPCIECGVLTRAGSRCDTCGEAREKLIRAITPPRKYKTKPKRPHYAGDYQARAKAVRENAIYCHICGDSGRATDPWTADHLIPGDPGSPLLPAHRSCNSRRGAKPLESRDP